MENYILFFPEVVFDLDRHFQFSSKLKKGSLFVTSFLVVSPPLALSLWLLHL